MAIGSEIRKSDSNPLCCKQAKLTVEALSKHSATKQFIESWARGLRQELGPHGIRVTNIQPGSLRAELKMAYGTEAERVFANCGLFPVCPPRERVYDMRQCVDWCVLFATCDCYHVVPVPCDL